MLDRTLVQDSINRLRKAKTLLVDANLLLVYAIGSFDLNLIGKHKRAESFVVEDFNLLQAIIQSKRRIFTTPHILAEVSNLIRMNPRRKKLTAYLGQLIKVLDEKYIEATTFTEDPNFFRFGLTDAVIIELGKRAECTLSGERRLCTRMRDLGIPAVNFNHIRTEFWLPENNYPKS